MYKQCGHLLPPPHTHTRTKTPLSPCAIATQVLCTHVPAAASCHEGLSVKVDTAGNCLAGHETRRTFRGDARSSIGPTIGGVPDKQVEQTDSLQSQCSKGKGTQVTGRAALAHLTPQLGPLQLEAVQKRGREGGGQHLSVHETQATLRILQHTRSC